MSKLYDLIIIGSGPAGLSAAIYAERARFETLIIEKNYISGGQILNTYEVDNYPGLPGISGYDLGVKLREHVDQLGAEFQEAEVNQIISKDDCKEVVTNKGTFSAKTVIIATGARHRLLGVTGEREFTGNGVSYCATCDGAFFKDKDVAVVGGGDVAVEDAIFLARMCKKVYVIHRRDELRAAKSLQEKLVAQENVEIIWDTVVESINGKDAVESLTLKNVKDEVEKSIDIEGIFVAIGILPNSHAFQEIVEMDGHGYIIAGEECTTSIPGIFAVGDVRTKSLRQIITAASDGAVAVTSVQDFLNH